MKALFYLLGILVTGAAAVFSYLSGEQHKELIKNTHKERVLRDELNRKITHREGGNLKTKSDKGEELVGDEIEKTITRREAQKISGLVLPNNLTGGDDNGTPVVNGLSYQPLNKTLGFGGPGEKYNKQLKEIEKDVEDIRSGASKVAAGKLVLDALERRVNVTLVEHIDDLKSEIKGKNNDKTALEEDVAKFKAIEAKIKKMFGEEGIETIEGGKEKLVELEATRKDRINNQENLEDEQESFKEKLAKNEAKIATQEIYFGKRVRSLASNEKKYLLSSVNFDWGFAVVKGDDDTKFFVNQKLFVLRGNKIIGSVTISAVEPGRVIANIDYKSLKNGIKVKKGDYVILADPADR